MPAELGAVVGERALQFINETACWTKEICPLNVVSWHHMPNDVLIRLYGKIKEKYLLPIGAHVDRALEVQCSTMYRHWRERLKKRYFTGKPIRIAERNKPLEIDENQWKWLVNEYWNSQKQKERSQVNRENARSKKMYSACGAKSTARVLYEMDMKTSEAGANTQPNKGESGALIETEFDDAPIYVKAWIKLKRHKNGMFDEEAEGKLKEFLELHARQIQEKGSDDLTIEEAFEEVLQYRSGYARGLGQAHPVRSKGIKKANFVDSELQRLRDRETELQSMVEKLKAESQREKEEALQREAKLREELRCEMEMSMQAKMNDFMKRVDDRLSKRKKKKELSEGKQRKD